jgi:hypothetical protein
MQPAAAPTLPRFEGDAAPDSVRPRATFPDCSATPRRSATSCRSALLIIELLRSGERVRFRARGSSMWPALPGGSLLEVTPCAGRTPRAGELVAFERDGSVVVHRMLRATAQGLELRGDALERSDGSVGFERVLGTARVVERRRLRLRLPSAREAGFVCRALWRRAKIWLQRRPAL